MFPLGFEFNPSGEDLIKGYLWPWVTQNKPAWDGVVAKELYGPSEPWEVFGDLESKWHSKMEEKGAIKYTIYAYTSLSRVSNSKRVSRRAGSGTWGGQTGPKKIQDSQNGQIIGQSKMLAFEHPGSTEADLGHWTMHEYSLSDELIKSSGQSNAADFVVCKITKTVKKKNNSDGTRAQPPLPAISYGSAQLAYLLEHSELWIPEMFPSETGDGSVEIVNESGGLSFDPIVAQENGDCSGSVANPELHGDGVWVRPPQIINPAVVGDGSGDHTDVSVSAVPIASKKRAAEEDDPNEQDGEGALKRQKTSNAGEESSCTTEADDELSAFTAELELDLMDNDDEESTNAAELSVWHWPHGQR
ncbi:hypothetical protein AAHA92_02161 [Salvia divinorum]|uniref:NAC domain-containing protein n=1 Tax=Salvia divinorum TaxID=28513 RepID=A0ABD1IGZ8_SALDI